MWWEQHRLGSLTGSKFFLSLPSGAASSAASSLPEAQFLHLCHTCFRVVLGQWFSMCDPRVASVVGNLLEIEILRLLPRSTTSEILLMAQHACYKPSRWFWGLFKFGKCWRMDEGVTAVVTKQLTTVVFFFFFWVRNSSAGVETGWCSDHFSPWCDFPL